MSANDGTFTKDPQAVLDYKFDFAALTNGTGESNWLADGETIIEATVTAEAGITVDSDSITDTNTSVTVIVSGGELDRSYAITCHIVTSSGNEDDRTIRIRCRNR